MGQQPKRLRRVAWWAMSATGLITLTACSATTQEEWKRGAMPEGAANFSDSVISFWQWTWIAALIVGVMTWGLILFAAIHYRRRHADEIPVQTRYNLPMELLYTVAPVVVVLVFFKFVIDTQSETPYDGKNQGGDHNITVVGQQWSWTFNYVKDDALDGQTTVYEVGSTDNPPTLYLVEGESVRFRLHSPDVIHDFWVPAFTYKIDVVPGRENAFDIRPTREGTFAGKCAELCGTYHSRMLFNVKVVSRDEYAQQLKTLEDQGNVGVAVGGSETNTQDGLNDDSRTEGTE